MENANKATAAMDFTIEGLGQSISNLLTDYAAIRAQRDELAAALDRIERTPHPHSGEFVVTAKAIARAALAKLDGGK